MGEGKGPFSEEEKAEWEAASHEEKCTMAAMMVNEMMNADEDDKESKMKMMMAGKFVCSKCKDMHAEFAAMDEEDMWTEESIAATCKKMKEMMGDKKGGKKEKKEKKEKKGGDKKKGDGKKKGGDGKKKGGEGKKK